MAYSRDLRERVLAFVEAGGSKSEASRIFGVSRWCVYNWLKRVGLAALKPGPKQPRHLLVTVLEAHVAAYPDAYQKERALALGVSDYVVWYGLKRLGIKKNATVPRNKRRASQRISEAARQDS